MWNIKAPALTVKKLLAKVKFLTDLLKNRMTKKKETRMTELKWPSLSSKKNLRKYDKNNNVENFQEEEKKNYL